MTLKLDVSKAYDRVEWSFLRRTLLRLGLNNYFVDLIMTCVTTVTFSFLMNGVQFGFLQPSRGIKQGDPLSPYLFICIVEAFIALIAQAERRGEIRGIRVSRHAPSISTLCFADDTLLFCRATEAEAVVLKGILDKYALVSGQVINYEKSSMTFSKGTSQPRRNQIQATLGVETVTKHDKYLGMPATVGRSKKEIFIFLRERIWARINGWGESMLSSAGREIMIKAVLQAIPSYIMSCFLVPKKIIQTLESAIRSFWWSGGSGRKMAWVSWRKLCQPKSLGGMGFRDIRAFNLALLAKQGWRFLTNPDSLIAQVFKARYFSNGDFLNAQLGSRPSAVWRGIWTAREYLIKGLRYRVGTGNAIAIWADPWIPDDGNFKVITPKPFHSGFPYAVSDLIDPTTRTWNHELVTAHLWEVDRNRILRIPICAANSRDRLVWHYTKNGAFSVSSCYHMIFSESSPTHTISDNVAVQSSGASPINWNLIWNLNIPPKVRMFLWRAVLDILPHRAELFRRKIASSPFCELCPQSEETTTHVFQLCRGMDRIWSAPPFSLHLDDFRGSFWLGCCYSRRVVLQTSFWWQ